MKLADVHAYLLATYAVEPASSFEGDKSVGVFSHPGNAKWFAATKNIRCRSVDVPGDGRIDILNVRLDPREVAKLRTCEGFRPAWRMNQNRWVTVLLGEVADDEVRDLLDKAYAYASRM